MRNLAMDAVVALIEDLGRARAAGASDADLAAAREQQRIGPSSARGTRAPCDPRATIDTASGGVDNRRHLTSVEE